MEGFTERFHADGNLGTFGGVDTTKEQVMELDGASKEGRLVPHHIDAQGPRGSKFLLHRQTTRKKPSFR